MLPASSKPCSVRRHSQKGRSGYWYALQFDGNGKAVAAWASKHPLTEAELQPTDYFEQRRLLKTFTHQDEAVGYYRET